MCRNFLSDNDIYPEKINIDCSMVEDIIENILGLRLRLEGVSLEGYDSTRILTVKIPSFRRDDYYELEHEQPKGFEEYSFIENNSSLYYNGIIRADNELREMYAEYLKRHSDYVNRLNELHRRKYIQTCMGTVVFMNDFELLSIKYKLSSEYNDVMRHVYTFLHHAMLHNI